MSPKATETVPVAMLPIFVKIEAALNAFCQKYLNAEYAALSRKLAIALARKRPSPLARGQVENWACAIIYALGTVNFLFDRSQTPSMSAADLCMAFGVSQSTGASKAKQIRDLFKMYQLDPRWCLPSLLDDNPIPWLIQVDGFLVDARHMPREIQEVAVQKGLIPYLPDK